MAPELAPPHRTAPDTSQPQGLDRGCEDIKTRDADVVVAECRKTCPKQNMHSTRRMDVFDARSTFLRLQLRRFSCCILAGLQRAHLRLSRAKCSTRRLLNALYSSRET